GPGQGRRPGPGRGPRPRTRSCGTWAAFGSGAGDAGRAIRRGHTRKDNLGQGDYGGRPGGGGGASVGRFFWNSAARPRHYDGDTPGRGNAVDDGDRTPVIARLARLAGPP